MKMPRRRSALIGACAAACLAGAALASGALAQAQTPLTVSYDGNVFSTAGLAVGNAVYVPLSALATALGGKVVAAGSGAENLVVSTGLQPPSVLAAPTASLIGKRDLPPGYAQTVTALTASAWANGNLALTADLERWGYLGGAESSLTARTVSAPGSPLLVVSRVAQFGSASGAALAVQYLERSTAQKPGGFSLVDTGYLGVAGQDGVVYTGRETVSHRTLTVYIGILRQDNEVAVVSQAGAPGQFDLMDAWPALLSQAGAIGGGAA